MRCSLPHCSSLGLFAVLSFTAGCKDPVTDAEPSAAGISAAMAGLPACEPIVSDGRIDLVAGCFDGLCVGQTYRGMVDGIGYDGLCSIVEEPQNTVECHWDRQIYAQFEDKDRDGIPDSGVSSDELMFTGGLEAGTVEGLGVYASTSCFIAQFGEPDEVTWADVNGDYMLIDAVWVGWGLHLIDDDGPPGSLDPDGRVDHVLTSGAR